MPPIDKIYQDVQLNIDFSKEIAGASALPDTTLYSNLIPSETASSGTNTNNIAVSFAKLYKWAEAILTFTPGDTTKVSINSAAYSDTTYSFREYDPDNPTAGAFQVRATGETWQTIAVHNVATLDSSGKVPQSQLPSYVDDVIEAYYYNGEFYKEAAHTNVIDNPRESGKIYVDISTSKSYRWGGTSYVEIKSSMDVFTGATAQADGVAGIVPAPLIADRNKFLKGDGTWATVPDENTTYTLSGTTYGTSDATQIVTLTPSSGTATTAEIKALVGATSSAAGKAGLVPVPPKSGYNTKFLRADGSWVVPTNTTYSLSTGTTYGTGDTSQTITLTPSSGTAQTATIAAMTGADGTNAGKAGLVPKPAATDSTKFLTGAGTWEVPTDTNTTYTLSGAYGTNNNTWVTTLTPSTGTATTSTVPTASTSVYGITKLSSSTSSTSTSLAATASAVKAAYDLANSKSTVSVSNLKTSGTKIATITVDGTDKDVYVQNMTASTSSAAGTRGTVQAPVNSMDKYLRGDNTWVEPVEDFRTKVNNDTFTLVLNCTNGNPSS